MLASGQLAKHNCWHRNTKKLEEGINNMSKNQTHYLPSGKVYTGPTHKTGSKLMTGAKHTAKSQFLSHTPPKKKKK